MTGFCEHCHESSRSIKTVDILISSSSVHSTVDVRAAVQCSTAATTTRILTAAERCPCSPTASSVCERHRSTFRIDTWFTPTSRANLLLLLDPDSPKHDRERPTHCTMQSGQVVCFRSWVFLPAGLLSSEVNDQQKRMWCDVANLFLDIVRDKYGETLRCFLSLLRKRGALSFISVQHKRRITTTHECHITV
jgi:hypothetical protein